MRLAISLATRGRPELLLKTIETTLANMREPQTRIFVAVDDDDVATVQHIVKGGITVRNEVTFHFGPREDSLGGKYNRILKYDKDADVYLAMVDYAPHVTPGFDTKILEAASFWPDNIGVVYNHMANLSFPQINAVTGGLIAKMGYMYVPFFPYWFIDHWLDDVAKLIDRIAVADVWIDCSARPGTQDRRDPAFWATFYDTAKFDRHRIARHIIKSPDFQEPEWKKTLLLHNYRHLIDERSIMVNDNVRAGAAQWAAAVPPEAYDERYLRIRNEAIGMLRAYVAEMDAEEATVKINRERLIAHPGVSQAMAGAAA